MLGEDTLFSSVRTLGDAIRTRKLSPVELTEAYLKRLETIGPKLNAVVTVTRDLALAQARSAEKEIAAGKYRGPLHGIPYGAKDALAAKGIPTTWGTAPYRNQIFDYDSTVIARLRDAGAVLLGKLAMLETVGGFGFNSADASFTGPVRTPWNLNRWAGGSSSGPGAATAAGLVAFSIGSETGGSILNPSTFCGLAGIRPTYGRVSRHGVVALCWTLDKVGPMCRSADDCGLVLSAIAGYDRLDATTSRRRFEYGTRPANSKRFKLAIVKGTYERAQPEIRANFEKSVEAASKFASIDRDVAFPDYPYGQMIGTIVAAEGASAFRDIVDSGRERELQNPQAKLAGFIDTSVSAVDYLQAQRVRKIARLAIDEFLTKYDAVIAPTMNAVSGKIGEVWDRPGQTRATQARPAARPGGPAGPSLLSAGNLAGIPGITVPNGLGEDHVPTGVQFVGSAWSEKTLIAIADAYQQATDWHKQRPPIA
jgi:aspartyl-tRNA(Asn)/glutamyl-tRNA(Gln) amidotransferase subunit A